MTADPTARSVLRLRLAGALTVAGLLVEALTLLSHHHFAFVLFLSLGSLLVGSGILIFVWPRTGRGRRRGPASSASRGGTLPSALS